MPALLIGPEKNKAKYSLLSSLLFFNSRRTKPSNGEATTPTVMYARPNLSPISMASLLSLNLQNFSSATSSAILNATLQSCIPNSLSSSSSLSTTPLPLICGATVPIKPSTLSAMFSASIISTSSTGSNPFFLATLAYS